LIVLKNILEAHHSILDTMAHDSPDKASYVYNSQLVSITYSTSA
jgi:hypothetical protein